MDRTTTAFEALTGTVDGAKLRWRCRRGMKELDVLLERFLAERYPALSPAQQVAFQRLLELEDPDLHACLIGQQTLADSELNDVLERIRRGA